ncbi:MAG: dephospho-CoA kinase [Oscillospiraceae bacterium]
MSKIIAITGRSGSGKSEVSLYLRAQGYTVIDADKISRDVLLDNKDVQNALTARFGDIKNADNTISRVKLAQKAFETEISAKALTDITHPAIVKAILDIAHKSHDNFVFVDGAVIVGEIFEQYCDKIIAIIAPYKDCILRIIARDGVSTETAEKRLAAQIQETALLARADYVIDNSRDKSELINKMQQILQSVTKELYG